MHTQACNAMKQLELNVRCSIIRINVKHKLNRLGYQDYACLASNHTKLVRQGDNPNKKIIMYISYVLCVYR